MPAALDTLDATAARLVGAGHWTFAWFILADLAEAAIHAGVPEAAARAGVLVAQYEGPPRPESLASLGAYTSALADQAEHGATPSVMTALTDAATAFAACGWPLYQARAEASAAATWTEGDCAGAAAALSSAAAHFDATGAVVRRDRVLARLARLDGRGGRSGGATRDPSALTRREREVVQLASLGRTAREIGVELFIGERTVETHLANAYAKLGVGSKLELVRMARDLDF
jgi:DNA-binding CsgD family transcriptional regulator